MRDCHYLAIYVHAHQTGNAVPPHIEAEARAALIFSLGVLYGAGITAFLRVMQVLLLSRRRGSNPPPPGRKPAPPPEQPFTAQFVRYLAWEDEQIKRAIRREDQ